MIAVVLGKHSVVERIVCSSAPRLALNRRVVHNGDQGKQQDSSGRSFRSRYAVRMPPRRGGGTFHAGFVNHSDRAGGRAGDATFA